ncbi:Heat-inducible transcription repressor HrcA [Candidatus Phytoplasma asteris]|uniref:Heat-inducible transcription repressor HrcA n=3 Tax=16SrI (Aster yellows group) TaxID=3042590 RepID=HRCA_AYWBP|nr:MULTISPECIES: heat-inducible transcriptional repressor HrcA [16SrI (Aster yellows group)]Q2NK67.1 RecName: Full=Heat-inducible transcription repressor HrcA [Aster yellows witches'-broom phytoplasma AYWB]ABC65176.1 heat-inducible transcription repressor [Aster yellows witches'-broom phytoplasma AYWB]PEH36439.1 heat-inducible transcription repressor HrcA [New Jersey aster yellows phytoplasma]
MMNMLSDRKKLILKAVVENYSQKRQPVGSKMLTYLPYLKFASATIRYDMVQLEKEGFLQKNHTSSGRVPSFKGYVYYLNHLLTRDHDVACMFESIDKVIQKKRFCKGQVIKEALNLLNNLTNYTTMAIGSDIFNNSKITKIDFIPLNSAQAVILIITDKGNVQHQNISLEQTKEISIYDLKDVVQVVNDLLKDKFLSEAAHIIQSDFFKKTIAKYICFQEQLIALFMEAFSSFASENLYFSGVSKMLEKPELNNPEIIKKFMGLLERKELLKIMLNQDSLSFKFSDGLQLTPLKDCMILSIPFDVNPNEKGRIAVVGPSWMKYPKVIPILEYLAVHLSKLNDQE